MMRIRVILLMAIIAASCTRQTQSTSAVDIALIDNNKSIKFTGLDKQIINEIARDSNNVVWQNLIPIYAMPADTDMKNYQPVQPGRYVTQDSIIVFTPDTPFVKGKTYFVRNYKPGSSATLADYIKGHAKAGQLKFTDLIFKP